MAFVHAIAEMTSPILDLSCSIDIIAVSVQYTYAGRQGIFAPLADVYATSTQFPFLTEFGSVVMQAFVPKKRA